jgi:CheY-like chemotaxis protein
MRIVLEGPGYQIWEASDCLETLNIWKRNGPLIDLLLADLVMPGDATSQLTSLSNLLTSFFIKSIVRYLAR